MWKVILVVICVPYLACQLGMNVNQPLVKKNINSIPIEAVDTETMGKKSGSTHFSVQSGEMFLDYENFDSSEFAITKFETEKKKTKRLIEEDNLVDNSGSIVGKLAIVESGSKEPNYNYCLYLARRNKFTSVCAETQMAINEFRELYEF